MTVPADGFLIDHRAPAASPSAPRRWLRPAVQWLGVGLAHAVVLALVLHMSPQARRFVGEAIQASLIAPQVEPSPPPPEPPRPKPLRKPPPREPVPAPVLAAAPVADAPPASFVVPTPSADPAPAEPVSVPAAVPPPLTLPIFNAAYLDNPPPVYPAMSRRLRETGRVLLRVFVSADGRAERVEIRTPSGFDRLDHAAREAVIRWRFVPARRGDEQVAAWVQVPIVFVM